MQLRPYRLDDFARDERRQHVRRGSCRSYLQLRARFTGAPRTSACSCFGDDDLHQIELADILEIGRIRGIQRQFPSNGH